MLKMLKGASAAALALALMAGSAPAEGLKAAADVKIAVVVHGASSDAYWSVVKRGVDDAARDTGAQVQYIAPQVFDSVEQARLIEAAVATAPDGIVVSIPDKDALSTAVTGAVEAGIPVVNINSGETAGRGARRAALRRHDLGVPGGHQGGRAARRGRHPQGRLHQPRGRQHQPRRALQRHPRRAGAGRRHVGGGRGVAGPGGRHAAGRGLPDGASRTCRRSSPPGPRGANPLIKYFNEQELWAKYKLFTYDLGPEILQSVADGKMGFGIDGQQYLMGYLPVVLLVQNATHGLMVQNNIYTGPLFIDTPEKAEAVQTLSKEGTR